ncbi:MULTISPECIES: hypothetical protein [unclassified Nocardioides]|uniref:hypothetical protein n=1 Tax=unclassified Nocardioides TaxID=2615069 RepID=UPI0009F04280|nr:MULTISPECIES: hypothetical protein [unclassified Nocardioides]GAW51337.1 uncharacterized protein (Precursor) [Nocardioides sp. PD653-B2]GAW52684.1 uncharacterized protein (Precursor) [Nocardioides sp. PD653]
MVVFALMVIGGIVLATVAVVALLRGWGRGVSRTEAELHDPAVRTLAYAVPPGRDPAELLAALAVAGYRAIEERPDRLLIACPQPDDPEKVRLLLDPASR